MKVQRTSVGLDVHARSVVLRQYFPKGTDLSRHSVADLQAIAEQLNARPRKVLDWDTPPNY